MFGLEVSDLARGIAVCAVVMGDAQSKVVKAGPNALFNKKHLIQSLLEYIASPYESPLTTC